ncbi:glycosyltransferase family 4 protein [Clostridium perfringens]|uniref:glycosyltransferase family 4 protein n=1 Tax=Clostridium perfringens TaxID=1502 RepID=UPI0013E37944|nr:glycosyltransferase family 4 protein [Clostridium perfringens]ELC8330629.1 glycosyltransferase family 4 protein [Clostridium perfringens]NGT02814.1 glycosyltransferase family 4 protein [Clostridium perfringens]
MKILYIAYSCSPTYGSEDAIGWNIPFQAAKAGHIVDVITKAEHKEIIESWIKNSSDNNIPKFHFIEINKFLKKVAHGPLYTLRLFDFSKKAYKIAESLSCNSKIDIIHQITPVEFRSIGDYGNIKGIQFILGPIAGGQKIHKSLSSYSTKKIQEWIRILMNRAVIQSKTYKKKFEKANVVLFANDETKDFFIKNGYSVKESIVIPEIGVIDNLKDKKIYKDFYDNITFLMVGRLITIKGFDIVLDSITNIKNKNFNIRICGDGELLEHFKYRIKEEKLGKNVELIGFVDYREMESEYKNADVLIMPSLREATGTVLVEAMTHGIPVITFNQFGAKKIVSNKCGYILNLNNCSQKPYEKIAEAIDYFIENSNQIKIKGKKAQEVIAQFTWEKKFELYSKIYLLGEDYVQKTTIN